jgi:four helix bundle protein
MSDPLKEKSYSFALRIMSLCEYLHNDKHEYVISRKLLDSAVNIGLLIEEGKQGDDRADFLQKHSVANKEAFKSNFLLRLLRDKEYIVPKLATSLLDDCEELQKLLISTLKTLRRNP